MTTAGRSAPATTGTSVSLNALGMSALALLLEGPRHPYEMFRIMMSRREDVIVKIRAGSLYHAVGRLADAGLVRAIGIERAGNRPERTTYEVTPAGRAALRAAVAERVAAPVREYPIFPVALAEIHALAPDEAVAHLRTRIDSVQHEVDMMRAGKTSALDHGTSPVHLLDLDYLIHQRLGDIAWLTGIVGRIERSELDWIPLGDIADPTTNPPATNTEARR